MPCACDCQHRRSSTIKRIYKININSIIELLQSCDVQTLRMMCVQHGRQSTIQEMSRHSPEKAVLCRQRGHHLCSRPPSGLRNSPPCPQAPGMPTARYGVPSCWAFELKHAAFLQHLLGSHAHCMGPQTSLHILLCQYLRYNLIPPSVRLVRLRILQGKRNCPPGLMMAPEHCTCAGLHACLHVTVLIGYSMMLPDAWVASHKTSRLQAFIDVYHGAKPLMRQEALWISQWRALWG